MRRKFWIWERIFYNGKKNRCNLMTEEEKQKILKKLREEADSEVWASQDW
jgi:phosphoribosyl-ATP pyrophosphohydrolase